MSPLTSVFGTCPLLKLHRKVERVHFEDFQTEVCRPVGLNDRRGEAVMDMAFHEQSQAHNSCTFVEIDHLQVQSAWMTIEDGEEPTSSVIRSTVPRASPCAPTLLDRDPIVCTFRDSFRASKASVLRSSE